MTGAPPGVAELPDWLRELAEATRDLDRSTLTPFSAPQSAAPRRASVLIVFGEGEDGPHVLLLERSASMRSHAGQIAFPGGAQDTADADAVAAALREAQEETGIDPGGVRVIATLPTLWLPPSNFEVTPVVGWWHTPSDVWAVDPAETSSVHTVSLSRLLDPAHRATARHPQGHLGPAFFVEDLVVWGFTAHLLSRLFAIAGWERPWDDAVVVDLPTGRVAGSVGDAGRMSGSR